jgi:sulfate permease, SulP family
VRSGPVSASWLPILAWVRSYDRAWLRDDVVASFTVWALVVPQSIAYAQIAGLPPQAGLFAAFAGLVGYAILGTSRQLVVSPTSSTAAISASLVASMAVGREASFASLSAALALTLGIVFVVLSLAKLGFVSRFIPVAVSIGFLFGLGLTIIIGQLTKILGVPSTSGSFVDQAVQLVPEIASVNGPTLVLGALALVALLLGHRFAPAVPMALIVVVAGVIIVAALGLEADGVAVIGLIDASIPLPALPRVEFADLVVLVPGALAIAVMGYAETNQVAEQFGEEHRYEIRPDQELLALGGANLLSGVFQGMIVAGGASQSAAADRAGARTLLVSLIVAGLTVLTAVALMPLFRDLPQAVLGAIVISAVLGFLRVDQIQRLAFLRRDSLVSALFALVATLTLGILAGLITAVLLALIYLLVHISRPSVSILAQGPDGGYLAVERHQGLVPVPGILVVRLDAPLLFLNAKHLRDEVRAIVRDRAEPVEVVLLDLAMSAELDVESRDVLAALAGQIRELGADLWLVDVRASVASMLERPDSAGATVDLPIYATMDAAMSEFATRSEPPDDEIPRSARR